MKTNVVARFILQGRAGTLSPVARFILLGRGK
jgi:hypothetical protein